MRMPYAWRIDGESFGANCPDNWEEVANALNEEIERRATANGIDEDDMDSYDEDIIEQMRDIAAQVWEDWCCDKIGPAAIGGWDG